MPNKKIKKLVAGLFLLGGLLLLPFAAFAQVAVPTFDPNNGNNPGGLAGVTANLGIQGSLAIIDTTARTTCEAAEFLYEKTDSVAQLGFSGLALIGGDSVLLAQLQAKITAYNGFITCRQGILDSLKPIDTPSTFTANLKQQIASKQTAAIQTYKSKLEQAQARYNNAKQGFWKTLVFNILIKTSKSVADSLVTKLVSNYKITNMKAYADSLATLMYDNQFIRDNYPDAQGQLMARAILENPEFRYKIHPAIFTAADQALGYNPKSFDVSSPNFYTNMAAAGSSIANPYFQSSVYIGGVDQAKANSLAASQAHIAQSSGLKTPVNCLGSLSQQKSIDLQSKAASDLLANRQALLTSLQNSKAASASDLAKAQADYDAALRNWNNLPYSVTGSSSVSSLAVGGGNNTEGSIAIKLCEAIVSPTTLINKGIDQAFNAIGQNMAQYNNNNLPGFISLIGDAASQISTSFIFGGSAGAKNAALINEGRVVSGAVQAGTEAAYSNASGNLANGIQFDDPTPNPGVPNSYTLTWNVLSAASANVANASFVTISGNGISATTLDPKTNVLVPNKQPLSGSYAVTVNPVPDSSKPGAFITSYPYILTVFDATGRALTSATVTITLPQPGTQALNYKPNGPAVAGAFTSRPAIQTRGPEKPLFIR